MAVMHAGVKAVEEPFESMFPKPTLISFQVGSLMEVLSNILAEEGVQQGGQGLEALSY